MTKPMHILICGQVRDEEMFRAAIARFQKPRMNGAVERIVFSTWTDEVDRYPGLSGYLADAGVEIVETVTPLHHMETAGNYFYQATQLTNGLERFDPEDFIFKTRGDVRINFALGFRACKRSWEERELARPLDGEIFRHRVAIGLLWQYIPFWMEDRYSYGCCADLRRLARLSRAGDILWNPQTAIAEIRLYGGIFAETFPAVRHMMRINWMLRLYPHDPVIFQNEVVYRSLAIYHHIVDTFFTVGLDPPCVDYSAFAGSIQPPPATIVSADDPVTAAYRAQPAYIETRRILAAEGTDYLSRPEVTAWFREAVNRLGQDTAHIHGDFVQPLRA